MEDTLNLKKQLYALCTEHVEKRVQSLRSALKDMQDSVNEETKSSAGDKHETGRAMMQLETEQLSSQLREVLNEQDRLRQIQSDRRSRFVEPGALVITDSLRLYFAISVGKLLLNGEEYFALSLQTPLGLAAKARQEGGTFAFQNKEYCIKKII